MKDYDPIRPDFAVVRVGDQLIPILGTANCTSHPLPTDAETARNIERFIDRAKVPESRSHSSHGSHPSHPKFPAAARKHVNRNDSQTLERAPTVSSPARPLES
ncbi:MAG: hypothetical protein ABSG59_22965 [Verrucomicrobiota bacterium]|jgi:hypothetical protein